MESSCDPYCSDGQHDYYRSRRRGRLCDLVVRGFEHLVRRNRWAAGKPIVDGGRGAGYVVWVPQKERQRLRKGEEEGEEDGERPAVLYGGGYDGLFTGGLEQAIDASDCLAPPLRWVRLTLELLPPPAPPPPNAPPRLSSTSPTPTPGTPHQQDWDQGESSPTQQRVAGAVLAQRGDEHGPDFMRSAREMPSDSRHVIERHGRRRGQKSIRYDAVDDSYYYTTAGDSGEGANRMARASVSAGEGHGHPREHRGKQSLADEPSGRKEAGLVGGGGSASEESTQGLQQSARRGDMIQGVAGGGGGGAGGGGGGGRGGGGRSGVRPRPGVDVWWLTDPPPPRVAVEAFRLRVAMDAVQILPKDAEEAPVVVCTIEVCQGRPYAPGRLQRYPNVATSSGLYRAVYSYEAPTAPSRDIPYGSATSSVTSAKDYDSSSPSSSHRQIDGDLDDPATGRHSGRGTMFSTLNSGEVSIIDVLPGYWYNVRHRFCWNYGGGRPDGVEEVVSGTRHVHTEAFIPPATPPPRPRAVLGCVRHPQHEQRQDTQNKGSHFSRTRRRLRGVGGGRGLAFLFRFRWGRAGAGHEGRLFFNRGGTPQENEYVLQQCCVISPGRNAQYQNGSGTSDGAFSNMARAAPPPLLKAKSYSSPGRRAPNQSACVGNSVTRARYIKDPEGKTTRNKTDHPFLSSTYWGSSSSSRSRRGRGSCECSDNGNTISYGDGMSKDGVNNGCYAGTRSTDNLSLEDWFDDHASSRGGGGWRGTRSGGVRGGGTGGESVSARWSEWKTVCRTRKTSATVQLPRPLSRPHGLRYRVGARRRREKGKQVKFSEVLEVPTSLLHRLYDIEEISSGRSMSRSFSSDARQISEQTMTATERRASRGRGRAGERRWGAMERRGEGGGIGGGEGLGRDEALQFAEALELSGEGDDFPARVAWELQTSLWQQHAEETNLVALEDAKVIAEAETIQCTLEFPVNARVIAGVIRQMDANIIGG